MSYRGYVAYVERLERDMQVLKDRCRSIELSNKIDALEELMRGENAANSAALKMKNTIGSWLSACQQIPWQQKDKLVIELLNVDLFGPTAHPSRMADDLQSLAHKVRRYANDPSSPEVELICKSLVELAGLVALFEPY